MGLLVDIEAGFNTTMSDVKDVYIRIETLQIYPKQFAVRANVTGFVNPESGYVMKKKAIADVKQIEPFFFTNEILNGYLVGTFSRDNFIPPQTGNEPQPIFRDYYTLWMLDEKRQPKEEYKNIAMWDTSAIYKILYEKIKEHETRFTNVRDIVTDPIIEEGVDD